MELANAVPLLLAGLLLGLAIGAGLAWLLLGARHRVAAAEAARAATTASAGARAEAAAAKAERTGLLERIEDLHEELQTATERLRRAESEVAATRAALQTEREGALDRERMLAARDAELRESFRALSAEALSRNNEQFVSLAEGRIREAAAALHAKAEQDEAARSTAIGKLLDPMAAALQRVEGQLRTVEKERESAYAGLVEQVKAMAQDSERLRTETKQLVTALRAPQVRGRWGELQLERIVQLAGMVEHCDFETQVSAGPVGEGVRPDMIVHLAGGKQVVVDAKVPFAAYLEAVETADPARHTERLSAHARQLRAHVDQLSGKAYWQSFEPTPEFVVLFVPGDPFLEAALRADPALLEHAFAKNVVIATPTTLIALLRTVAYGWRQEALARNAQQVHQLGRELHGRLATMGTHVAKLGRSLDGAVESYNRTVSSLEARVLVTARRLTELRVSDEELEAPAPVERVPRAVSAPELVASAGESLIALHELVPGDTSPDTGRDESGPDAGRATVTG
ncbi:DNA recombination protein RmuC [Pseudonocardia sp. WMMC193]|uniref:DNA recombination protein RmuC n=1 Tax=Pseudonocardia sp. WMMC193 TaxID=2911965 RepID=UPI001F467611|nr:DNA recombination protein RmuC [Pseudonocardia sp. WMMC193]MCF7551190.1 DNA recombination protein RmuC [Pseudonocardia sp. WMMC193]